MDLFTIVTERADYELGALVIIDQTQLPEQEVYLALKTPEEIWEAIYLLKGKGVRLPLGWLPLTDFRVYAKGG